MNYCGNITKSVMLWEIFVDLLMGTGMTGSKLTSEPGGNKGGQRTSTVYQCAWSNQVIVSKDVETSGSVLAWSSIALWLTSPQESFTSWRMESSGLTIPLNARILSSCRTTSTRCHAPNWFSAVNMDKDSRRT